MVVLVDEYLPVVINMPTIICTQSLTKSSVLGLGLLWMELSFYKLHSDTMFQLTAKI